MKHKEEELWHQDRWLQQSEVQQAGEESWEMERKYNGNNKKDEKKEKLSDGETGTRTEWISRISRAWNKTWERWQIRWPRSNKRNEHELRFHQAAHGGGISIRAAAVSPPSGHQSLSLSRFLQTSLALSFDESHTPSLPPLCCPVVSPLVLWAYKTLQSDETWCQIDFQMRELILDGHRGAPTEDRVWENTAEQWMTGMLMYVGGLWGKLIISDGSHGAVHLPGCIRINVIYCSVTPLNKRPKEKKWTGVICMLEWTEVLSETPAWCAEWHLCFTDVSEEHGAKEWSEITTQLVQLLTSLVFTSICWGKTPEHGGKLPASHLPKWAGVSTHVPNLWFQ